MDEPPPSPIDPQPPAKPPRPLARAHRPRVWRRHGRTALRWVLADEKIHAEWKGAILLAVAAIFGGLVTLIWNIARGIQTRQEFDQDLELRAQDVITRQLNDELDALRNMLARFAHEIPRNNYLLDEAVKRNVWLAKEFDRYHALDPLQQWLNDRGYSRVRYADGSTYVETSRTKLRLVTDVYEGQHYFNVCSQAKSLFTDSDQTVESIARLFDLMNDIMSIDTAELEAYAGRFDQILAPHVEKLDVAENLRQATDAAAEARAYMNAEEDARYYAAQTMITACVAAIDTLYYAAIEQMSAEIDRNAGELSEKIQLRLNEIRADD